MLCECGLDTKSEWEWTEPKKTTTTKSETKKDQRTWKAKPLARLNSSQAFLFPLLSGFEDFGKNLMKFDVENH